jgi:hypothetical protein
LYFIFMSREVSDHERFVRGTWRSIRDNEFLETFTLPGRKAENPAANNLLLGLVPFTKSNVPHTEELAEFYGNTPHAAIRIAGHALLAFIRNQRSHTEEHVLVNLSKRGWQPIASLRPDDQPIPIGRRWLSERTGISQDWVSREHFMIGAFGNSWLVQDLGSHNGTSVAVEAGTAWYPGDPTQAHIEIPFDELVIEDLRQEEQVS